MGRRRQAVWLDVSNGTSSPIETDQEPHRSELVGVLDVRARKLSGGVVEQKFGEFAVEVVPFGRLHPSSFGLVFERTELDGTASGSVQSPIKGAFL